MKVLCKLQWSSYNNQSIHTAQEKYKEWAKHPWLQNPLSQLLYINFSYTGDVYKETTRKDIYWTTFMKFSLLSHKHKSDGDDLEEKNHLKTFCARHQNPRKALWPPQKWRRMLFSVLWTTPPWLFTVYKNWSFGPWLEKCWQKHMARKDAWLQNHAWGGMTWLRQRGTDILISSKGDTKHSNNSPPSYCFYHSF